MVSKIKKFFFITFIFFLFFLSAEIIIRIIKTPSPFKFDKILGWKVKENYNQTFNEKDKAGNDYIVNYTTNQKGLRTYGNNENNSKKILVIGDSHTMGKYTGNNEMWFSVLAEELKKKFNENYFVYAGGANGYGSLQEYLLAKDIADYINPDIFILQFCENDYTENHLDWDERVSGRNTYLRRPYYSIQEKTKYNDSIFSIFYRNKILSSSKIFNKLDILIERFQDKYFSRDYTKKNSKSMEIIKQESMIISINLVSKIRNLFNDSHAYIVNCNPNIKPNNIGKFFHELAKRTGYVLIESPPNEVEIMRKNKKLYNQDGAHLSPLGNKIFGEAFANELILLEQ